MPSSARSSRMSGCRRSRPRCRRAPAVLGAGGLVCASASAVSEGMPPPGLRPEPLEVAVGDEPGFEALVEHLALAGYERVERVDGRGQMALRGGLVDVFPATGRD